MKKLVEECQATIDETAAPGVRAIARSLVKPIECGKMPSPFLSIQAISQWAEDSTLPTVVIAPDLSFVKRFVTEWGAAGTPALTTQQKLAMKRSGWEWAPSEPDSGTQD